MRLRWGRIPARSLRGGRAPVPDQRLDVPASSLRPFLLGRGTRIAQRVRPLLRRVARCTARSFCPCDPSEYRRPATAPFAENSTTFPRQAVRAGRRGGSAASYEPLRRDRVAEPVILFNERYHAGSATR